MLVKLFNKILEVMPLGLLGTVIKKTKWKKNKLERIYIKRKVDKQMQDAFEFSGEFLDISKGSYPYGCINVCFVKNMLANILYCIAYQRIPVINNVWNEYYEPISTPEETSNIEKSSVEWGAYTVIFDDIYSKEKVEFWGKCWEEFIRPNQRTRLYFDNEEKILQGKENVLGVVVRGTDYLKTKPKGHPVQPDLEEVVEKIKEFIDKYGIQYIYLATEDSKVAQKLKHEFPNMILENKRMYYDEKYDKQNSWVIGEVCFDRENDDYLKGIEYLSSLNLLSKCDYFVGGNCGATEGAVYMNRNRYKDRFIFNKGLY